MSSVETSGVDLGSFECVQLIKMKFNPHITSHRLFKGLFLESSTENGSKHYFIRVHLQGEPNEQDKQTLPDIFENVPVHYTIFPSPILR